LRAGGKYQIGFQPGNGKPTMFVGGEFLTVAPPGRLEYTWIWEKETDPDWQDRTVVTIEFNALGTDRTEVVLTHARFSKPDSCEHHKQGWVAILDRMAAAVGKAPR
jgi:uncharacterized protein YndB with AHSA1/START domain